MGSLLSSFISPPCHTPLHLPRSQGCNGFSTLSPCENVFLVPMPSSRRGTPQRNNLPSTFFNARLYNHRLRIWMNLELALLSAGFLFPPYGTIFKAACFTKCIAQDSNPPPHAFYCLWSLICVSDLFLDCHLMFLDRRVTSALSQNIITFLAFAAVIRPHPKHSRLPFPTRGLYFPANDDSPQ